MDGLQEINHLRDHLLQSLVLGGERKSPMGRETIPAFILPYQLQQPFRLNHPVAGDKGKMFPKCWQASGLWFAIWELFQEGLLF